MIAWQVLVKASKLRDIDIYCLVCARAHMPEGDGLEASSWSDFPHFL